MIKAAFILLSYTALQGYASPITLRNDDTPKKDDSFFLSFVSTILITILAAAILIVFYRYAVKYIPSKTIRIPLRVFSRVSPDGMIRLPTSEEESAALNSTFDDLDNDDNDHDGGRNTFRDNDDDDIPPSVGHKGKKVKMTENEEDFFDVSDEEEQEQEERGQQTNVNGKGFAGSTGVGLRGRMVQDEGTKAWRD